MRILVVDDHPLMREAIVMLFRRIAPDAQIIECDRIMSAERLAQIHGDPDFICLDLKLPDAQGTTGITQLRQLFPHIPLVVLSATPAEEAEDESLLAGADLYLEKSSGPGQLAQALTALISPESALTIESEAGREKLSRRQKELIQLLDRGLSNKDLAQTLQISEHTVKVHLWRLFRRLDVKNRQQAVHWARSRGQLSEP